MINGYPTEEELRNRMMRQLSWRNSSDTATLLWRGYLSGLFEWGLLELSVYERLLGLLSKIGSAEQSELFADEPLSKEQEREIQNFTKK